MQYNDLNNEDQKVMAAAIEVIRQNYDGIHHSVGAAVLGSSGKIFSGVNVESCGYGPCAEPIALGAALSSGERDFLTIVAIDGGHPGYPPMPPCGNCRQLLLDYAPDAMVILNYKNKLVKVKVTDLLPSAYHNFPS
jgi:cytidine deaminase